MQRYKSFFAFASVFEKTSKNHKNHSSDKKLPRQASACHPFVPKGNLLTSQRENSPL